MIPVQPGDVLAGKYRIDRVLGMGGMGVVVAAHHLQLDEAVALKFLLPESAKNPQVVARFLREGRAAAKIRSEHVARVFDVGTLDDGAPFMVMEYLQGQDLAALLASHGPRSPEEAADYVLQACEAIAEAHALGIVHRDLKPHNLFLTRRVDGSPCVKVLDFGISKAAESGAAAMTNTTAMMGSPLYMSPEQMTSARNADQRSDIWALGIIVYELLTAKTPFDAESIPQLVIQVTQHPARDLRADRPDAPAELEAVVRRCLQKSPADRYRNVAELARDLAPFVPVARRGSAERIARVLGDVPSVAATIDMTVAGHLSSEAGRPSAAPVSEAASVAGTQAAWGATNAERRRPSAILVLALLVGGAAVGLGAYFAVAKGAAPADAGAALAVASETAIAGSAMPPALVKPQVAPAPSAETASTIAAPPPAPVQEKPVAVAARAKPAGASLPTSKVAATPPPEKPTPPALPPAPKSTTTLVPSDRK